MKPMSSLVSAMEDGGADQDSASAHAGSSSLKPNEVNSSMDAQQISQGGSTAS